MGGSSKSERLQPFLLRELSRGRRGVSVASALDDYALIITRKPSLVHNLKRKMSCPCNVCRRSARIWFLAKFEMCRTVAEIRGFVSNRSDIVCLTAVRVDEYSPTGKHIMPTVVAIRNTPSNNGKMENA